MADTPARPICTTCRHIRDDVPNHSEYYLRCGWWDGRPYPITTESRWAANGQHWITRKTVEDEAGARLPDCLVWEARDA